MKAGTPENTTSPRRSSATTRLALREAARQRFLADSYDSVSLRDIARDAGVDVALVGRYFGSKEELFKEVLRGSGPPKFDSGLTAGNLPDFLVSLLFEGGSDDRMERMDRLLIMLRSASSPAASEIVRAAFREDVLEPLVRIIPGPQAEQKVFLAMAVLTGTSFLNTVLTVRPFRAEDPDRLRGDMLRLLKAALVEEQP